MRREEGGEGENEVREVERERAGCAERQDNESRKERMRVREKRKKEDRGGDKEEGEYSISIFY